MNIESITNLWPNELDCAITVCDTEGVVVYQNDKSRNADGNFVGKSMIKCHGEKARGIIDRLLTEGGSNTYTIEKKGAHKLIHQTPWRVEGKICGLVEFSIVTPEPMEHFVRG